MRSRVRAFLSAAALLAIAGATSGAGAITLENYQKYRLDTRTVNATTKSLVEVRLEGVLHGLNMANQRLRAAGGKPLFCAPAELRLRGKEVMDLLDGELKSPSGREGRPYAQDTAIEDVLLIAAQRRWPCAGQ
jgi:hypothetical protein